MLRALAALLVAACMLLAGGAAHADDDEGTRLDRGEVVIASRTVKGFDTPEMIAKAVIDAPPARVWQIVSRCGDYARTMPRIKASKEVSRKGDRIVCQLTVSMPAPYADLTSTTEATHTEAAPKFTRVWKLKEGDYKVNSGSWVLTPYKGDPKRTLAVYTVLAEPKRWIPAWIRKAAQKKTLPEMMERLRQNTK